MESWVSITEIPGNTSIYIKMNKDELKKRTERQKTQNQFES